MALCLLSLEPNWAMPHGTHKQAAQPAQPVEYHLSMWNTAPGQQEYHFHRRKCNTRATASILPLSLVVIHRPPLHQPSLNVKILPGVEILCCLRLKQKILCSAEAIKKSWVFWISKKGKGQHFHFKCMFLLIKSVYNNKDIPREYDIMKSSIWSSTELHSTAEIKWKYS